MADWKKRLQADPTAWLLEDGHPGVRRLALTGLLDRPESNPEVLAAGREAMMSGVIPKILAGQDPEGFWGARDAFYTAKYKGTSWRLILLAELGADGRDDRIRNACEFILANSRDPESGGFAFHSSGRKGGGRPSEVIPCLSGNMVWSLIRLGFLDDPRVEKGIDWIVRYQRFDDGDRPPYKGRPYEQACWGKHTCHMGAVKSLKALDAIPKSRRTAAVRKTIETGVEYLLIHHIHKKSHNLAAVSKPGWLRLGFPWMYQTDILEILGLLTRLGYRDERMREAVDVLLAKQGADGTWILENTFNGRFPTNIERKGKSSRWVTAHALIALKKFFE
ncbi:MAG: terpene cyclase/mutase family protein [Acidobacteriota bacterium]|nr:terpene cyclase/mutase family protein [Acidobacteriota bacterium]